MTKQSDSNLGPKQSKCNVRQKKRKKSLKMSAKNISPSSRHRVKNGLLEEKNVQGILQTRHGGLDNKKNMFRLRDRILNK